MKMSTLQLEEDRWIMINYKLCINKIEIDLNKLGVSQSKTLQAIDLFTMLFDSNEELVAYINNKEDMQ